MRKIKNALQTIIILMLFTSCVPKKVSENNTSQHIFDTVYFQKWIGGLEQTGSGYDIYFSSQKPLPSSFDFLKVIGKHFEAIPEKINDKEYRVRFSSNIAINRTVNDTTTFEITYTINGELKTESYRNLKEKPMIAYPSMEKPKN